MAKEKKNEEAKERKTTHGLECSTPLGETSVSRVEWKRSKRSEVRGRNDFHFWGVL